MSFRKVIRIDEAKCDGCGECVTSCAEGAIAIRDGKARLVSEIYCDGLGACLGHCPQGAITIEEREAEVFDEAKTREHLARLRNRANGPSSLPVVTAHHPCPGSMTRTLGHRSAAADGGPVSPIPSALCNWPVQLTLVSPGALYFRNADVLLVADCVPFACADFHQRFLRNRPVIIGCPKLDQAEFYVRKLAEIIHVAQPRSLSVVHMEVPCCAGLTQIAKYALAATESDTPLQDVTVSISGEVLSPASSR